MLELWAPIKPQIAPPHNFTPNGCSSTRWGVAPDVQLQHLVCKGCVTRLQGWATTNILKLMTGQYTCTIAIHTVLKLERLALSFTFHSLPSTCVGTPVCEMYVCTKACNLGHTHLGKLWGSPHCSMLNFFGPLLPFKALNPSKGTLEVPVTN